MNEADLDGWKTDPEVIALRAHLEANNGIRGLDILDARDVGHAAELFLRDGFVVIANALTSEQTDFLEIAFEVFSSYSTVGLSLGLTPRLTDFSKFVLIFVMFIGRVGALNILIGMLRQIKTLPYRYPEESVIIN